jgi:hypothetical protein
MTEQALRKAQEDFEAAEAPGYDVGLMPVGFYRGRITGVEFTQTLTKGTPCLRVTVELSAEPYAGRSVARVYWLTERAMRFTKRELADLGVSKLDDANAVLVGKSVRVDVGVRRMEDLTEFNVAASLHLADGE